MSSQTEPSSSHRGLPPVTFMDFLSPDALNEVMNPADGNGRGTGPSPLRYQHPPHSQPQAAQLRSQPGEGQSQAGCCSLCQSVAGSGLKREAVSKQGRGQGLSWFSEQRQQIGRAGQADQKGENDV